MAEISTPVTTPPLQSPALLYSSLPKTSLYVGDLHPQVTEADLIEAFDKFGSLFSVRVCRAKASFKSLGYGFVNFWKFSDASKALASLNHTELKGKTIRIMWCERDPSRRKNIDANLYVKNLDTSITSSQLEEMFGKYGRILSCKVVEKNGESRGFGFVQFESADSAMAAVNSLNGFVLEGKKLCVCKFVKRNERTDASTELFTNLYVHNLDKDVSEDILREKFSEYGKVIKVMIIKDSDGLSKGFGFIQFDSCEEAVKAIEDMNGAIFGSRKLYVARAQKRNERPKSEKLKNLCDTIGNSQIPSCLLFNEQPFCSTNWNAPYDHIYYETAYKQPYEAYLNPDVHMNYMNPIDGYCQPKNFSSCTVRSDYGSSHDQTSGGYWKEQKSCHNLGNMRNAPASSGSEARLEKMSNELWSYIQKLQMKGQQMCSDSLAVHAADKGKQVLEGK